VRDGRRWNQRRASVDHERKRLGFNIYLHLIRRSDDDRALHDHPWPSVSVVMAGQYIEHVPAHPKYPAGPTVAIRRRERDVIFRRSGSPHRLEIGSGPGNQSAFTLFITGPRFREWGFWCPKGWKHWSLFTLPTDSSKVGVGCGGRE
jgi:hypothetical protein